MVTVREVKTAKDVREFIELPLRMYKGCPQFVPPLYRDEKKLLMSGGDTENAASLFLLAERDGKTVGRLQGIIQKLHNEKHGCAQMRFTRFDCADDAEAARALFAAAEEWGARRGMNEICGPLGYSDLDREGLLIEGFEENSTFEEQYNYPYYAALLEGLGFQKDADWVEYELKKPEKRSEMLSRVAKRALELNRLHVADTDIPKRKYIEKYRDGFFDCLDECYRELYGTVPLSREMQDELIDQFMMIVNKKYLVFICDDADWVVGFGLCFPGIGSAVKKSGGRLTPPALCRILKTVRRPRVLDLGLVAIRPAYQRAGLNAVILDGLLDILENSGVEICETNLNLETNTAVQAQWKYFSARQHKRRRSYIKKIGDRTCSNS